MPPLTSIASAPIKPDHKSSIASARSGKTDAIHQNSNSYSSPILSNNSRHNDILTNTIRANDISSGCSRTIPISWTSAASSSTNNIVDSRNIGCSLLQVCYKQNVINFREKKKFYQCTYHTLHINVRFNIFYYDLLTERKKCFFFLFIKFMIKFSIVLDNVVTILL